MTAIVIVNYIKYEDTFAAVDSVLRSETSEDYKVIIVDNGSTNNAYERLRQRYLGEDQESFFQTGERAGTGETLLQSGHQVVEKSSSRVIILRADSNRGYCAGNNIGIRYAIDTLGADYIWILNPDTLVEAHTLDNYVRYIKDKPYVGIVGAKLIFYPDSEHMQAYGGGLYGRRKSLVMGPFEHLYKNAPVDTPLPPEIELDVAIGASMMVRKEVFKKIGFMNEDYFLYSDENEFCLRAKRAGFRITAIRDAVVYHKEGYRQTDQSLMAEYYLARNSLYMVKDLYPSYFPIHYFFFAIISSDTIRKFLQGRYDLVRMKKRGIRDYKKGIKGRADFNI